HESMKQKQPHREKFFSKSFKIGQIFMLSYTKEKISEELGRLSQSRHLGIFRFCYRYPNHLCRSSGTEDAVPDDLHKWLGH
ncbi:hypothetical protein PMAYCL1PPCAC_04683, partial [Pristionchus mayeri]